jgi:hypothetical protein
MTIAYLTRASLTKKPSIIASIPDLDSFCDLPSRRSSDFDASFPCDAFDASFPCDASSRLSFDFTPKRDEMAVFSALEGDDLKR